MKFSWFGKEKESERDQELMQEYGDLGELATETPVAESEPDSNQYLVERLEQIIDLAKETEEQKSEYRIVNAYLNDIQMLEDMPAEERRPIEETAQSVVQLNAARTEFLNSAKKISDAQFAQMEREERDIPGAIRRMKSNEAYRDTLLKDMRYLEREKSEWQMRRDDHKRHRRRMKSTLYILIGLAATVAVIFLFLQFVMEMDLYYAWMFLVFATAICVCLTYLRMQNDIAEVQAAERSINRAIALTNKVKIKYVGIANAVEYACEKYHVRNAKELNQNWEYYMEAVKEREKFQSNSDDLEYFNGRLVRQLSAYRFYDAKVWITQAQAILDAREMVEIKHEMIGRRQKLRAQIEYDLEAIAEQKEEVTRLLPKAGSMRPQVEEILMSIEKLSDSE
jgi:hypothetical protein